MKDKISCNLQHVRRLRGMTQAELAAKLTIASGEQVLPVTVSRWERGERNIPAYMLGHAARVLRTSTQAFYDYKTTPDDKRLLLEYAALPEREKNILRYIASGWDGDTHALVHWVAMYTSIGRCHRADVVQDVITSYETRKRDGYVDLTAPAPDMDYLEQACGSLRGGKKRRSDGDDTAR